MDYVEAASLLGSAIALSGEFQTWKEAEAALIVDPKAQTLIKEYKDLQKRLREYDEHGQRHHPALSRRRRRLHRFVPDVRRLSITERNG